MKSGRPTLFQQQKIEKILFSLYENNIEAYSASKKTGINYKTVLNYYKKWNLILFEQDDKNFLKRIKLTKEKSIRVFDADIISLTESIKKIEKLLNDSLRNGDFVSYEKLSRLKLKIMDQRTKIQSAKINLIGVPTADYTIHQSEVKNDV